MDKVSVLCVSSLIERFNTNDNLELFNVVQDVSEWLTKSVKNIAEFNSFNEVQSQLLNLAKYIVEGKVLTRRCCNKLVTSLTSIQKEMLNNINIVIFVTPSIKLKFNENVKVVVIEDEDECIDLAYSMQNELKYLLYMKNQKLSEEIFNATDISFTFEELIDGANTCYPLDIFTYDRLYLTSKLAKIEKEKSKILLTGSSYTMVGLLENKMPYSSSNVAVNAQDLYYTLLSVKEAMNRSENLEYVVISFAYYFFFSNMNDKPSDYMISVLSKVNYPVYKRLHGYNGELKPVHNKVVDLPIFEAVCDISEVRDIYHNALINELSNMSYYNQINVRPEGGMLGYNFREKNDEQNSQAGRIRANGHNTNFNLERGIYNQKLLDKFLDNMEELNKKVILFIPPATKFYQEGLSKDMINSYNQLVMPIVNSHKCCTFIDLFKSDKFNENDFQDYDHLNLNGANKLSDIISSLIVAN